MEHKCWLTAAGTAILLCLVTATVHAERQLDDATILGIFDQTNAVDIYNGRLGAKYGHSPAVRALGEMVATEHVMVQQRGRDLAKRLGIVPMPPDNDTSIAEHGKTVAMLRATSGSDFDTAYLHHQMAFHQSVIDAVKETLLPAVRNSELKTLVSDLLPGFEHHLAETQAVARKLGVELARRE